MKPMAFKCLPALALMYLFCYTDAHAYSDYYTTVPNGDRFSCGLCHIANSKPQGASTFELNPFGRDYQAIAIPAGSTQVPKWTYGLAKLDSDGDGYTNGEELQEITGDVIYWEPRQPSANQWVLTAGNPAYARNPGDGTLSIPKMSVATIKPTRDTINVGDHVDIALSGQATVPGRVVTFSIFKQSQEIAGALIEVLSTEDDQGYKKISAHLVWTPSDSQGGDHTIGIQATDGTETGVQSIHVVVLGGVDNTGGGGGEPPPPPPIIRVTDFTASTFDFDKSLMVDLPDFTLFAQNYGKPSYQAGLYDFDKSGTVDWHDLLFFAYYYGRRVNNDIDYRTPAGDHVIFVPVAGGSYVQLIDGLYQSVVIVPNDITKYEISNRQYRNYLAANYNAFELTPAPYNSQTFDQRATEKPDHPVIGVTWDQADKYCKWVGGRLPTIAEWTFAAQGKGDKPRPYAQGQTLSPDQANYLNSGDPYEPGTTPIGYYSGRIDKGFQTRDAYSLYGAYDMTGNVWEWCADVRTDTKPNQAPIKGGGFRDDATSGNLDINTVQWLSVTDKRDDLGFRCLREK